MKITPKSPHICFNDIDNNDVTIKIPFNIVNYIVIAISVIIITSYFVHIVLLYSHTVIIAHTVMYNIFSNMPNTSFPLLNVAL